MVFSSSFRLSSYLALAAAASLSPTLAFQTPSNSIITNGVLTRNNRHVLELRANHEDNDNSMEMTSSSRRSAITTAISSLIVLPTVAFANQGEEQPDLQKYDDFTATPEGWSYKDVKDAKQEFGGGDLKDGDRVVFDWSGYTIGYFGRPFEAKGGPQGGAFDKSVDYFRTVLGSKKIIPGLECALRTMKPGAIRQVIVPYGPLSYPVGDKGHELVGPKPTTFSGMRALDFVLDNPRVDRTLLFNVKLIRVDRSDGKGGFIRG